jgi:hypothetical protein
MIVSVYYRFSWRLEVDALHASAVHQEAQMYYIANKKGSRGDRDCLI